MPSGSRSLSISLSKALQADAAGLFPCCNTFRLQRTARLVNRASLWNLILSAVSQTQACGSHYAVPHFCPPGAPVPPPPRCTLQSTSGACGPCTATRQRSAHALRQGLRAGCPRHAVARMEWASASSSYRSGSALCCSSPSLQWCKGRAWLVEAKASLLRAAAQRPINSTIYPLVSPPASSSPPPPQLHELLAWYWHVTARTMVGLLTGEGVPPAGYARAAIGAMAMPSAG